MSRLSEIWACLVRKLFFCFLLDLAEFIDKVLNRELYITCGLPDMKWLKKKSDANRRTPLREMISDAVYCPKLYTTTEQKQ